MTKTILERGRSAFILIAVLAAFALGGVPRAADEEIPTMLKQELESVLKKKVADLLDRKDADGIQINSGTYSRGFRKVDETTYKTTFHVMTLLNHADKRDRMKVDRYLVTLKKDGAGNWAIANEDLQQTYDGLYRYYLKPEFYKFDSMSFEKEGLKVTATNGYLYKYFENGKVSGFRFISDDLAYSYAPPVNMGYYGAAVSHAGAVQKTILREHPEDVQFKPERVSVQCDAETCEALLTTAFKGVAAIDGAPSSGAYAKLKTSYDEVAKDLDKRDRENSFGGFDRLDEPDNRYWSFSIKKDGIKEHYLIVTYDNFDAREVEVRVWGYGFAPVFSYNSEETRNKNVSPYELESREDEEARDYDLMGINGSVDLLLEDQGELKGDITYTMKIKRDLQELPFYISRVRFPGGSDQDIKNPKLFVNSIEDGEGNDLTWVKLGAFRGMLIFPAKVAGGSEIKLRMKFTNFDSIYQLNPSYAAMDRGGWLPFVRFADMIDSFDLTVRTPAKYEVLGIGKRVSSSVNEGVRTTRWTSPFKVSFPTIIFGEYESDDAGEYQATKLDGTVIPVNVYVDKVSLQAMGFEAVGSEVGARDTMASLQAGARDIRGKQLRAIATQASVALNIYKEVYGVDYPFAKLDLVADPLGAFYGQAPASIIYLGFGVFRGEGALAADESLSKFNKDVVAHETGHQWWGSLICNANDRNYWFVETLAEVSSALYVEKVYGKKKYLDKVAEWRRNIMDASPIANVQDSYTVWGGYEGFAPIANIYNKGPYAFHVLRETFGDEKFFAFLKQLAQTLKGKEIVTRDIQNVAEQVYGGNMEWFFDQWIRGIGIPQYALYYTIRKTEDGKWLVDGKVKQRVVYGPDKVEMPDTFYRAVAPLTFVTHAGKTFKSKPLLVEGAETPFKLKVPEEPAEVKFNADGEILAQDILVNRSW